MKFPRRHWPSLILTLLWVGNVGCATNPATGNRELRLMSQSTEIRLGEKHYRATLANQGGNLSSDIQASHYVSEVGHRLAAASQRPDLPYEFTVINSSEPHAWSLPGGKIGISRGLLAQLESEAELAAVLGHQIGHVVARDGAKAFELDVVKDVAITTIAVGATFFGIPIIAAIPFLMRQGPTGEWLTRRSHSEKDEIEADRLAMGYMESTGYDVNASPNLITRIATSDMRLEGAMLQSHPISRKRLANAHMIAYRANEAGEPTGEEKRERFDREMARLQRVQAAYSDYDAGTRAYEGGDYDAALSLARRAAEIVPNEARFYELEGDVLMATQHYEDALASYDRSVEYAPDWAPAYMRRASARRALGDHGGAQQDFATSYLLQPSEQVKRQMGARMDDWDDDPFFHQPGMRLRRPSYHSR